MSFSTVMSAAIDGLHVEPVHVEADISNGLPMIHMVGYLSSEVKEASERVKTAIHNSGVQIPAKKIIINLAPATVRKRGASFDFPIALSMLAALGEIPGKKLEGTMVIGELSLDGSLRDVPGVLPIVAEARNLGCTRCILPQGNASEGALADGIEVFGAETLGQAVGFLKGETQLPCAERSCGGAGRTCREDEVDFGDIQGQDAVKRAVEVAVAGGHNILLIGPPGSGKSMVARRIPTILPKPSYEESLEITRIYSVLGMVDKENPLMKERPFRSVHHTVTRAALTGGGLIPSPGEISLAHGGVLFLDELAEFKKQVLEVLRQPLEERKIRINRARGGYEFPADFMLVAAMNPCPCGNYPDLSKCSCTPWQIQQYLAHISQPLLDRIDICIETPKVGFADIRQKDAGGASAYIRKRVEAARLVQRERHAGSRARWNALLGVKETERFCRLGREEELLMKQAFAALGLTARTYHKILKVARTIADLDGEADISGAHLKEAIGYRTADKKYWRR